MNKKRYIVFLIFFIFACLYPSQTYSFDRTTAQKYLAKWWDKRNTDYFGDWDPPAGGGDCANFGSQCLIAGNILLDKTKFHTICPGWTWNKGCITGAEGLRKYLNSYIRYNYDTKDSTDPITYRSNIKVGDIIFWTTSSWSGKHTLIVNDNTGSDIKFGSHFTDRYDFSLQDYAEYKNLYYEYLPDAPIIKYMKVTQVQEGRDTTVYEWNYDGAKGQMAYDPDETTGEYYKHTYDGLSSKVMYETVARGDGEKLKIKIIFDQTMNTSNIAVSFGKTSPYNTIAFTTEGWEQTLHPNDTWKGKVSIPKGKDIDGIDTISVNAFAPGTGDGT